MNFYTLKIIRKIKVSVKIKHLYHVKSYLSQLNFNAEVIFLSQKVHMALFHVAIFKALVQIEFCLEFNFWYGIILAYSIDICVSKLKCNLKCHSTTHIHKYNGKRHKEFYTDFKLFVKITHQIPFTRNCACATKMPIVDKMQCNWIILMKPSPTFERGYTRLNIIIFQSGES